MSRIIHQYHHRRRRVAGEGRRFVAPTTQHDSTPPEVSERMGGIVSQFIQQ